MAGAVAVIEEETGLPVLDRTEKAYCVPQAGDALFLGLSFVQSVTVRLWTPAGSLSEDPDGTTQTGRQSLERDASWVFPPAAGWPDRLEKSAFEVTARRGVPSNDRVAPLLRSVAVELARQRFQGIRTMAPTNYALRLLDQLKPKSNAPWN